MKVFLSYSRKDEAVAHLLALILTSRSIECLIDRKLPAGRPFDTGLREMIREADRVLLLLTESSVSSPWVNQEIGFALAHGKPIWPLAMEETIAPVGLISTTQHYCLFDWSNPLRTIDQLVEALREPKSGDEADDFAEKAGLDQVISGRLERARFVVSRLRELRDRTQFPLPIYIQAAFSSFAISDDPMYREAGAHSDEEMVLLLQERALLESLADQPRTRLKMLLWPVRAYDDRYLAIRYRNLLGWMKRVRDDPTIEYACAQYLGPNRIIVPGRFCLAGYKLHDTTGYEMSVVTHDPSRIDDAIAEFSYVFAQTARQGDTKERAIQQIEAMYRRVSRLPVDDGPAPAVAEPSIP